MSNKFEGDAKLGVSTTVKSAQSKKCRYLAAVGKGEIGLAAMRQVWESDSGLRQVCTWQEVMDRFNGVTTSRRNGDRRTVNIKLKAGNDWESVARIKVVAEDGGVVMKKYEADEELRLLEEEAERLEAEEAAKEAAKEEEAKRLMAREAKLAELKARVARFNRGEQE